jgi:DNA-binding MarR family transcriptional regulator
MLHSMSILEKPIVFRSRPPTAVYPDRHQMAQYREQEFPPTATDWERVFYINLEGGFFAPGALKEMIVPLAQAVRSGVYGSAALVVGSSDDGTVEFLEALAEKHELPIFISASPDAPLNEARPIGALTTVEMQTYGLIRSAGGEATSSRIADLAGIEVNAAVNRLSALSKKGYVHRVNRPRREGDAFVDLLSAALRSGASTIDVEQPASAAQELNVPENVRESIQTMATLQGSDPTEVLLRAWSEFVERHRHVLESESKEVRQMLKDDDREGLAKYANRNNRERAKQAAARTKR